MKREPDAGGASARETSAEQATADQPAAAMSLTPWHPIHLDVIDSTNRYLADMARTGAPHGTVVLADRQTAGRGRLGRRWVDVPGDSVLCSVLFRWSLPLGQWHLGGWIAALAGIEAAAAAAEVEATTKWPNDIVVGARKVAGVLSEVVAAPVAEHEPALVVGIGINCNWPEGWPPPDDPDAASIGATATSLSREAGRRVSRDHVASTLVSGMQRRAEGLPASAHEIAGEYRSLCSTIGQLVSVQLPDESFTGRALDVDDAGHLFLDVGSCVREVVAGDVVHLR